MVPVGSAVTRVAGLAGKRICVEKGTTHGQHLAAYTAAHNMTVEPVVVDSASGAADALFSGACLAYTSDGSQLAGERQRAPGGPQAYVILPETISREPLAPAVLRGDEEWFLIVRWVLFAQIVAEEYGVTRANVEQTGQGDARPGRAAPGGRRRRLRPGAGTARRLGGAGHRGRGQLR